MRTNIKKKKKKTFIYHYGKPSAAQPYNRKTPRFTTVETILILNKISRSTELFTFNSGIKCMPSKQSFATKKVDPHQKHRFFLKF